MSNDPSIDMEALFAKGSALVASIARDPRNDPRPTPEQAKLARLAFVDFCAHWAVPEPRPTLRWFLADGKRHGQYDEELNIVWLQIGMPDDQLIVTVGHELHHHRQWIRGFKFTETDAEYAGQSLLKRLRESGEYRSGTSRR